ncbi:hypothetical protein FZEAL_3892 [Fusarium zealandicum]|uniref:Uncharacterized protein n=1 Tax=Fusarium zealandicum TaxID=1053134 RepID=A0A8H4XM50_9HYPO|nr:hypothetical protein FZEAL_3892 [Fusarium zealandicum]
MPSVDVVVSILSRFGRDSANQRSTISYMTIWMLENNLHEPPAAALIKPAQNVAEIPGPKQMVASTAVALDWLRDTPAVSSQMPLLVRSDNPAVALGGNRGADQAQGWIARDSDEDDASSTLFRAPLEVGHAEAELSLRVDGTLASGAAVLLLA